MSATESCFIEKLGVLKKKGVANGRKRWPLITLRQIHSDLIHYVDQTPEHLLAGDGLLTDTPGLLLAVQAADCLPVIVVDRKRRAVGVFHAGWRGTVKRIVEKGVGEMRKHFGSDPSNLVAAIGPGVQACCYEVGAEVRTRFEGQFAYGESLFREVKESDPVREKYPLLFLTARAPGHSELPNKLFLDLVEANRRRILLRRNAGHRILPGRWKNNDMRSRPRALWRAYAPRVRKFQSEQFSYRCR